MSDELRELKQELAKVEKKQLQYTKTRKVAQTQLDNIDNLLRALDNLEEFYTNRIDELEAKK